VLENAGWLPTNVTQKAIDRKAVRPIEVELALPEGGRVVTGQEREDAGQLAGRVERRTILWWNVDEAEPGASVAVTARHDRAGTVHAELVL
jgi:hypothetical protein